MENSRDLRLAVFPWLAMGHLIPFLRLSILLSQKGHSISFISTSKNLKKLPKIPKQHSSSISLIALRLPCSGLPADAETTMDIPYTKQQLLKKAFDLLEPQVSDFLQSWKPDWVIYDYASHWLPCLTSKLGISSAFFSLFSAAVLSFIGPPALLMKGDPRSAPEDFTVVPEWVPFESNIMYRLHEVSKYVEKTAEDITGPSDTVRFGYAIGKADLVIIRSSPKLEPEWFQLFEKLSGKPVIPIGFLPPPLVPEEEEDDEDEDWIAMKEWLDTKEAKSVVYVCLGTEAALMSEEVERLAIGLEKSNRAFFWALKNPPGSTQMEEFKERVKDRGVVYSGGWVPQVKILSHESVGVFLTHCGWNSVVEGLSLHKVLIMFPVLNDQGLNARMLSFNKLGIEIPRNEFNGEFTSDSVAELLIKAQVSDSLDLAEDKRGLFGDTIRNNQSVDQVVRYLQQNYKGGYPRRTSPPMRTLLNMRQHLEDEQLSRTPGVWKHLPHTRSSLENPGLEDAASLVEVQSKGALLSYDHITQTFDT
ncbi:UDP-Glycosyltransferase superfamily protein [Euphorbia peplus]|nr:UDP-Glycosyltransferase superfamily protein [Euphorbia peplus]